jgi:hypothetical protein
MQLALHTPGTWPDGWLRGVSRWKGSAVMSWLLQSVWGLQDHATAGEAPGDAAAVPAGQAGTCRCGVLGVFLLQLHVVLV